MAAAYQSGALARRQRIPDRDCRQRTEFLVHLAVALLGLRRLAHIRVRRQRRSGNIVEIALGQRKGFGRSKSPSMTSTALFGA